MPRDNVQIMMGQTPVKHKIDTFFAGIGLGFNASSLRRAKMKEIITLEAQSDDDLARLGLTREQILPHVFRDMLTAQ